MLLVEMRKQATINHDVDAYRRGVVLGLTMAEILLLLVFCLLITSAVIFKKHNNTAAELREQITRQNTELADYKRQVPVAEQLLTRLSNSENIDDDWKKLVASNTLLDRISSAGLDVDSLIRNADDLKAIQPVLDRGVAGTELADAIAFSRTIRKDGKRTGLGDASAEEIARLARLGLRSKKQAAGEHDWPPIITLSEAEEYTFLSGSARLSLNFEDKLSGTIAQQVNAIVQQYDANVVEVIGHTDERAVSSKKSNLDQHLSGAMFGTVPIDRLVASDNTGLGMARAVSVARILKADKRLADVVVLPLSGGQLILPGDELSSGNNPGDVKSRRRIEIRVRRPDTSKSPQFQTQ